MANLIVNRGPGRVFLTLVVLYMLATAAALGWIGLELVELRAEIVELTAAVRDAA